MADEEERQPVNKPGTSCLGCRRRKLKCTREQEGCQNCTKADLPCVYPTAEVGVKRKRGPYRKDKPARQRHLEDLVRYLEPKNSNPDLNAEHDTGSSGQSASPANAGQTPPAAPGNRPSSTRPSLQTASSEDLVKDALIALTKSSVSEHESRQDDGAFLSHHHALQPGAGSGSHHPPIRRIFEYWQIFLIRVDPMTKVMHCPSLGKRLLGVIDSLAGIPPSTEATLFSIYYSAVSTCTARECRTKFGEAQDVLMSRYGRSIEAALGNIYEMPNLEALQALVLYLICIRRQQDGTNVRALWQLAVRSAQILGVHEDSEGKYTPFETEMRRRVWYHLHGLENSTAEEGQARGKSIMSNSHVAFPSNLNDRDLDPDVREPPRFREGVTDMTFPTLRFEIHHLVFELMSIRRRQSSTWNQGNTLREEQLAYLERSKSRLQEQYTAHLDYSRPYDWMCLKFVRAMLIKAQLIVDFPFGTVPTKTMPADERMTLLKASVDIISSTHDLAIDERVKDWLWYFRGYVQWHSLAIVVAELSWNANPEFTNVAWQVLDPILADWDRMYRLKRDEPAWEHVNTLIEKARHMRRQKPHRTKAQKTKHQTQTEQLASRPKEPQLPVQTPIAPPDYAEEDASAAQGLAALAATECSSFYQNSRSAMEMEDPGMYSQSTPMMNFDINFPPVSLESIDFNAFDLVFGSVSWDTMEPIDDVNAQLEEVHQCNRVHDMLERSAGEVERGGSIHVMACEHTSHVAVSCNSR